MEIYQNVWRNKRDGDLWMEQFHFSRKIYGLYNQSLMSAIDEHHSMDKRMHEYIHTMVSDPEQRTCKLIDITTEMYELRTEGQIEWDKGCDDYHNGRDV